MSDGPAKTPPAWVVEVKRELRKVEEDVKKIKSVQGADRLAVLHQLGELSKQIDEMFAYIKDRLP